MFPLSIRVAEDHGRQKAHYLEYVNHACLFNNRGKRRFLSSPLKDYQKHKLFLADS